MDRDKQETQNAKDIALIKQEIGYLRDDVKDIKSSLKILLENYITRKDVEGMFERVHAEIDGRIGGINSRMENKVEKEEFRELKSEFEAHIKNGAVNIGQIIQNVLTTVVTAIVLGAIVFAVQAGILK